MKIDLTTAELDLLIECLGGCLQSEVPLRFFECTGEDLAEAADREQTRGSLAKAYTKMKESAEAGFDEYRDSVIAVAERHLESLDEEAEESAEMTRVYRKLWHARHPSKI
jgi:hypothetical protein